MVTGRHSFPRFRVRRGKWRTTDSDSAPPNPHSQHPWVESCRLTSAHGRYSAAVRMSLNGRSVRHVPTRRQSLYLMCVLSALIAFGRAWPMIARYSFALRFCGTAGVR
eukprot:363926-Chlamydomonas_euryale.AAC.11